MDNTTTPTATGPVPFFDTIFSVVVGCLVSLCIIVGCIIWACDVAEAKKTEKRTTDQ